MSAESTLIPEDVLSSDIAGEPESPLNAEEATMIVLDFLGRMGRKVATPKSATLNGEIFVVEVDLKRGTARAHVNSTTREIVEYSITSQAEAEARTFPVPSRKSLMIIVGLTTAVCMFIVFRSLNMPTEALLGVLTGASDLLIIGGFSAVPIVIFIIWWRRRG